MRPQVCDIVWKAVRELGEPFGSKIDRARGEAAPFFGGEAPLDSLSFVCVITDIESAVEDAFSVAIVLANEEAFSGERAPFATIGSLIHYTCELVTAGS